METTKVFTNGRSQAVRIPKPYRFEEKEVYINRIGYTVLLTPKDSLAKAFERGASMLTSDFLEDGVPEGKESFREEL
ncbi:MAG: AbrB/MazE/SpoVT family DNA-binding domain-containing protein [Solobacterium sp.]|nr:AbrB/MazE/SpoVT family DNA-binding domain-containing protein [Solobacterium sp.]